MDLTEGVEAEITIQAGEDLIMTLERSLRPEVERPSSTRSKISLKAEDTALNLVITASDLTALRAALNSYLRWVQSIKEVVEKTRQDMPE